MSEPMNREEIRKQLGGYATNTLTDNERSALFEAALEDQDLFNALQDEQALKDLLSDPASRQAVRQALERPAAQARGAWWSRRWWSRRWVWGGAMVAVTATVFVVAVVHRRPAEPIRRVEIASVQEPANQAPANPEPAQAPLDQETEKAVKKAPQAKPPRELPINGRSLDLIPLVPQGANVETAPLTAQAQAESSNQADSSNQVTVRAAPQALGAVSAGVPATMGSLRPPVLQAPQAPLRYSLLKRDPQGSYNTVAPGTELQPGDTVRVNVTPAASGYLSLEKQMPSGEWTRVSPESPQGLLVAANTTYTIPDSGIVVEDVAQKFRISLAPGEPEPTEQLKAQARPMARAAVAPPLAKKRPRR